LRGKTYAETTGSGREKWLPEKILAEFISVKPDGASKTLMGNCGEKCTKYRESQNRHLSMEFRISGHPMTNG
jgi:hypothetical protein